MLQHTITHRLCSSVPAFLPEGKAMASAPEGATAPRWGRVQRCGEAWPLAGSPGGHAPDLAAQKYFCISYPLPLSASAHVALTGDNGGAGGCGVYTPPARERAPRGCAA